MMPTIIVPFSRNRPPLPARSTWGACHRCFALGADAGPTFRPPIVLSGYSLATLQHANIGDVSAQANLANRQGAIFARIAGSFRASDGGSSSIIDRPT